jgi:DNA-binding protein H-NS
MAVPRVERMSLKELLALQVKLEKAIAEAKERERATLKAEMEEKAARAGFSVQEVFGLKRKGRKPSAKYINPENPDETWAGRGRKPLWLVAKLKKGAKLEHFSV